MSDLRRVTLPSRTDRYVGRLILLVAVAILIAIAKPWGTDAPPPPLVAAVPVPTATPAPKPSSTALPRTYDFLAWGTNEPPPGWELWPAGTLSSFSFAMRIDVAPRPVIPGSPPPVAIGIPSTGPSAASTVAPAATPAIPETWPKVDIPAGSSLELVAVNHPLEYVVEIVGVFSVDGDGVEHALHAISAPSPWPGHFTIVGLGSDNGSAGMEPWPVGRYRLDIAITPGDVKRSIEIVVEPGPTRSAPAEAP